MERRPPGPRIALWMGLGALLTAAAATTWGLLRTSPEEITAEERAAHEREVRDKKAEIARLNRELEEARTANASARTEAPSEARDAAEPVGSTPVVPARPDGDDPDAQELLSIVASHKAASDHPFDFLRSEQFPGSLRRRASDVTLEGAHAIAAHDRVPIADGATIELPIGVTEEPARWRVRPGGRFPRDLRIRGQGMDRTLFLFGGIESADEIARLAFEDLTVCLVRQQTLVEGRDRVSLRLTRCRIVGAHVVLAARRDSALLAEGSRFEAGFTIWDTRPAAVVQPGWPSLCRFDDCILRGPYQSTYPDSRLATTVFSRCSFADLDPKTAGQYGARANPAWVAFDQCTFEFERPAARKTPWRSLTEIDPTWPAEVH